MSKFFKAMSLVLVFVFCFAAIPVSAAQKTQVGSNIKLSGDVTLTEGADAEDTGISTFGPALPVTNIQYAGGRIGTDGKVYITVLVSGQGSYNATWNGSTAKYYANVGMIGYSPVTGFYEEFQCGTATIGNHTFYIKATSFNFPYEFKTLTVPITIS